MISLTGKRWQLFRPEPARLMHFKQLHRVSDAVACVAMRRGIGADQFPQYSRPTLAALSPEPYHLLDMEAATERCVRAVLLGEKIGILGDYDVDGATSSALLHRFFSYYGASPVVFIPDRIRDGYGPCAKAYDTFKAQGVTLCITVDCGSSAHEAIAYGNGLGIDTVVTDHHIGACSLPPAIAVVNPNRADETSPHGYMAGAGVAFLLAAAVRRRLRAEGKGEPDLRLLLDLVALGTVCDVAPLISANRAFVKHGLKTAAGRRNIGLAALADAADIRTPLAVYHLGFQLGPRINAGGRVGESELGFRLLTSEDPAEAAELARILGVYNEERKAIEARVTEEACAQAEALDPERATILMMAGEDWHPGVIGIVAGRIKERFYRPCAVMAREGDLLKASLRSIEGADIGAAVVAAKAEGLLVAGGGHAMAAGFTAKAEALPDLQAFLEERLRAAVAANASPVLHLDAPLSLGALSTGLAEELECCAPYGAGNASPRFLFTRALLMKTEPVGADHLRCFFKDSEGSGRSYKAVCFRAAGTPLGEALRASAGKNLAVAGTLSVNTWQGNTSVEIRPEDVALQAEVDAKLETLSRPAAVREIVAA